MSFYEPLFVAFHFLSLINSPRVLFNPIAFRAVKICFIVPESLMTNRGFFIYNLVMRVHMV